MTAAVTVGHGGPDKIEIRSDWPTPRPGPDEVVVKVSAAGVNNTDIWTREGRYGSAADPDAVAAWKGVPLDFPRIQGLDIAGTVVQVGSDAHDVWVGRRVLIDPIAVYDGDYPDKIAGSEVDGGFAEFCRCSVGQLNDVSASQLTDAQLACLPTGYGTALGMINRAVCVEGERVLVTGSSGGVGMAAIQLLLARGCHVIARTSPSKADLVRSSGVAELSVRGVDALDALAEVDVAVDVVGGEEFGSVVDRLRDGGRLVTAGAIAGPVVPFDIRRLYLRQRTLIGSTMHTRADFAELAAVAAVGSIEPMVAATFPLRDIARAQERFVAKDFVGKLVIEP